MNTRQKDELKKLVTRDIYFDEPLNKFTSFGVGGKAEVLIFPEEMAELKKIVSYLKQEKIACFILGKGTNVLIKDEGIKGAVISIIKSFRNIEVTEKEKDCVTIDAQAGASLAELIKFCVQRGFSGLEFASGIPGSLGGGLAMNAGSFGGELGEIVERITLINGHGEMREMKKEKLSFSYRELRLPREAIVLSVLLRLKKARGKKVSDLVKKLWAERKSKQPLGFKSGGSIFKNPEGFFAGKLIEGAGLKGFRIGDAMVSDRHANFIVNMGKARSKDIISLMEMIQKEVHQKNGIKLEPEIIIAGE